MQTGTSVAPNNAASLITFAETRTRSVAIFAQVTSPIFEETNLTLGARYTWDKVRYVGSRLRSIPPAAPVLIQPEGVLHTNADKTTWRVSLDHRFDPNDLGSISYTRGLQTGTLDRKSTRLNSR